MTIVNWTPSTLQHHGSGWTLQPSGVIARVSKADSIGTVPVNPDWEIPIFGMQAPHRRVYLTGADSRTYGLPPPQPGILYIASLQVRLSLPGRPDILNPSGYIRNKHGDVTAFQYFEGNGA